MNVRIPKKKLQYKDSHFCVDPLMELDGDFTIIYGGRYSGKSYDVKRWVLEQYITKAQQFAYIRRWDSDVTQSLVRSYFADTDLSKITPDFNLIDAGRGLIEISQYDYETEKKHNRQIAGFYFPMNTASRYASTQYPGIYNFIVEEFIPIDGRYAPDELELLFHLFSTIIRERRGRVTLIANSISRQSPYWDEFGCADIVRRQEIGDTEVFERKTKAGPQKIVIHYARPNPKGNKLFSGSRETMTVEGKWLAEPKPRIDDLEKWFKIYTFYVEWLSAKFKCTYLVRGSEYTVYVEDYDGKEYPKYARVVSDKFSFSPYVTNGFTPLNDTEAAIFDCLPTRCCYNDDLVGTEFEEIFENFKISS